MTDERRKIRTRKRIKKKRKGKLRKTWKNITGKLTVADRVFSLVLLVLTVLLALYFFGYLDFLGLKYEPPPPPPPEISS